MKTSFLPLDSRHLFLTLSLTPAQPFGPFLRTRHPTSTEYILNVLRVHQEDRVKVNGQAESLAQGEQAGASELPLKSLAKLVFYQVRQPPEDFQR